jgi:hypothetical protein
MSCLLMRHLVKAAFRLELFQQLYLMYLGS